MYFYIHAWVRAAIPFGAARMVDKFVKNVGQLITMIGESRYQPNVWSGSRSRRASLLYYVALNTLMPCVGRTIAEQQIRTTCQVHYVYIITSCLSLLLFFYSYLLAFFILTCLHFILTCLHFFNSYLFNSLLHRRV